MSDEHLSKLTIAQEQAAEPFHNAGARFYTARQQFSYFSEAMNAAKNFQDVACTRVGNELEQHLLSKPG
jgi:hypothetical protein